MILKAKKIILCAGILALSLNTLKDFKLENSSPYVKAVDMEKYSTKNLGLSLVAHRGLSSQNIGNTKEAIEQANECQYISGIEFDVRLTSDDVAVLSHGNSFIDSENNKVVVSENLWQDIKQRKIVNQNFNIIDYLSDILSFSKMSTIRLQRNNNLNHISGSPITFEQTLDIVKQNKKMYIELKFDNNFNELTSCVDAILKKHPQIDFIIQSSSYEDLLKMKKLYPNYKYHIIITKASNLEYLNTDFDGYAIRYNLANYSTIKSLIDNGKEVSIWTIDNDLEFMNLVSNMGDYFDDVNYITDYPDCLLYEYSKQH